MTDKRDIVSLAEVGTVRVRHAVPADVAEALLSSNLCGETSPPAKVAERLLTREALRLEPVRAYVSYLKLSVEMLSAVAEMYDLCSPPGSAGKKDHLRHTGPDDIIHILNHLYILRAAGVEGDVLECGTSHGYSTCCISQACARLGRELYAADSFEGLPQDAAKEPFFRPGDYASPLDAVKKSVGALGCPASVEFVKGWFSESLRGWKHPLSLLWLDVDLYTSARDVMEHVLGAINNQGVLILHEFTDFHNRLPEPGAQRPPNAVFEALDRAGLAWRGVHIHRYFGAVLFRDSVGADSFAVMQALAPRLRALDGRQRAHDELRNARTVRWMFGLKKMLLGR